MFRYKFNSNHNAIEYFCRTYLSPQMTRMWTKYSNLFLTCFYTYTYSFENCEQIYKSIMNNFIKLICTSLLNITIFYKYKPIGYGFFK